MNPHRVRFLLSNILLLLLISLACILVAETTYRLLVGIPLAGKPPADDGSGRAVTFQRSENALLIYEPRPFAATNFSGVANSINSHGMRDREYTLEKPEGTFRMVMLGDSIMYGFGVPLNESFSKLLEKKLAESAPRSAGENARQRAPHEALNFGVPGYSTQQETELYRVKASAFSPDLVILGYTLNDFYEFSHEVLLFEDASFSLLKKWYVFGYLNHQWQKVRGIAPRAYRKKTKVADDFALLKKTAGNVPVLVVVFPYLVNYEKYPYERMHQRLAELAEENGFAFIDLLPVYRRHPLAALQISSGDNVHPSARGHEIAANETSRYLKRTLRG